MILLLVLLHHFPSGFPCLFHPWSSLDPLGFKASFFLHQDVFSWLGSLVRMSCCSRISCLFERSQRIYWSCCRPHSLLMQQNLCSHKLILWLMSLPSSACLSLPCSKRMSCLAGDFACHASSCPMVYLHQDVFSWISGLISIFSRPSATFGIMLRSLACWFLSHLIHLALSSFCSRISCLVDFLNHRNDSLVGSLALLSWWICCLG